MRRATCTRCKARPRASDAVTLCRECWVREKGLKVRGKPGIYRVPPGRNYPEGAYESRYRDGNGRPRRRTFRTMKAAEDFRARVKTDIQRGEWIPPERARTPFGRIAEKWYVTETPKRSAKTRDGYRRILDHHLLPEFGNTPLNKIGYDDIAGFFNRMDARDQTKRNVLHVLKPILSYASTRLGILPKNPAEGFTIERSSEEHRKAELRPLTPKEVRDLAEAVGPPYDVVVLFAAYSGMRAGEIAALRRGNLDLLHRRVRVMESVADVNGTLVTGPTKNKKRRTISIPRELSERLEPYVSGKGDDELVFTGLHGGPFRHGDFYRRTFKPAVRRVLPDREGFRFHDLRHTCASSLIKSGLNPLAVSRHMGHSSIGITYDVYGHLFPDENDRTEAALDAIFQEGEEAPREKVLGLAG